MKMSSFIFILLFLSLIACSSSGNFAEIVKLMELFAKPALETMCPKVETVSNQENLNPVVSAFDLNQLLRNDSKSGTHSDIEIRNDDFTVPGSILLLYGLNLFKYEAFPREISTALTYEDMIKNLMSSRGITEQLFELKCSKTKTTWNMSPNMDLHLYTPRKYIIPEHILEVDTRESRETVNDIYYENSVSEIITSLRGNVSFETDLKFLGGSSSSLSYGKKINTTIHGEKKIVELHQTKVMIKLSLKRYKILKELVTSKFVDSLKDIPDKYDKFNNEPFEKFFKMFGTHFFNSAEIGSHHYRKLETSKEFLYRTSKDIYEAYSRLTVLGETFEDHSDKIAEQQYKEFVEKSTLTEGYVTSGGMKSNYNERMWMQTWPTHPWVTSGKVRPITDLIEDVPKSKSVRLALVVMQMKIFNDTYGPKIDETIKFYSDRINYESYYASDGIFLRPFEDDTFPATYGCGDEIDENVNEMICCFGYYSVKKFKKAYDVFLFFYESPNLDPKSLNQVLSNVTLIQDQLDVIGHYCLKAKRREL